MAVSGARAAALAAILALGVGCGADDPADRSADDVLEALGRAGLKVSDAPAVDGATLGGGRCRGALVDGLDVSLCAYPSGGAARAAEPAGLALVGETTGAALARGHLLLVVADRGKVDPAGRKIDLITRIFLGKPPRA